MMASLDYALVRDVHMLLDGSGAPALAEMVGRVDSSRDLDEADDAFRHFLLQPQLINFNVADFAKATTSGDGNCSRGI